MAQNDYFVICYKILSYLYDCLKAGSEISREYLQAESFNCPLSYWEYIICHLYDDGYIEGVQMIPILGQRRSYKLMPDIAITPKGIEYLQNNSMMAKAKECLKTIKDITPGL